MYAQNWMGSPFIVQPEDASYSGGREPPTSVTYEAQKSHPVPTHVPVSNKRIESGEKQNKTRQNQKNSKQKWLIPVFAGYF